MKALLLAGILVVMVSPAFAASDEPVPYSDELDPPGANTGYYYFSGKVHECLMDSSLGDIQDEKIKDELKEMTSRKKLLDDATNAIAETKRKWLNETLNIWMLRGARYEEGVDSIKTVWEKDTFLVLDECNSLVPYIEKNIFKREVVPKDDVDDDSVDPDDQNTWKTWQEIK